VIYLLLFVWGVSAFLSYDFARQKGRNKFLWLALAIPFGLVALYALLRACAGNPVFGFDPDRKMLFSTGETGQLEDDGEELAGSEDCGGGDTFDRGEG